jgi:hypothetical protein
VPQYILSWLPVNSLPIGLLAVAETVQSRFSAPGLDAGYLNIQVGAGKNVQFTASSAVVKR